MTSQGKIHEDTCKNCGKKIYRESGWAEGMWLHFPSDQYHCRIKGHSPEKFATPKDK